ncbi:MAG: nuclear transport factor 2 family protein [Ignavibacteriaceae bacterium]|jgi:hypothetical protein
MIVKHLLSVPIFLLIILSCSTNQLDLESERQQVIKVLDDFVLAHETKDLDLLSSCFSDKPDIIILGTDEDELWVDKKSMVDAQVRAYDTFDKVKLSVRDKVLKIDKSGKTAWFYMKVNWFVESKGEKYKFDDVRTTGVLENVGTNWRIVQIHTSLPVEGKAVSY